ncbi:MAG: RibD family protein [Verrucomicrobia bacterium]|nr:RibD family protein [Verrucomicrobiota bacterium]
MKDSGFRIQDSAGRNDSAHRPSPIAPRPFIFINMAMTADGKIATANRAVSSFGSARDHAHLLELRATADAVMCGARTADLNQINLGPGGEKFRRQRVHHGLGKYNLRILVTGSGSLNPHAHVFAKKFSPVIVLTTARASKAKLKQLRAVADEVKICGAREINWPAALRWLREKWNVRRLLCEGGGELNSAFFAAGLVDELHLTLCAKIFGGHIAPTIADGCSALRLADAAQFELKSAKRAADELFLVYRAVRTRR